jgi:streptogramin lyase
MAASLLAALATVLSGCGSGVPPETPVATAASVQPKVSGRVHGGQQPVSGATIQLYAVGIAGLKSAATPLISTPIQTLADGSFNITGQWNCTSNTAAYGTNPQLYIVATGGNPGLPGNVSNGALAMMAALGPCSSLTASSFIYIDEVTTVASAVALSPFMADYAHIGAQGANAVGLVNAMQTANALANMATGTAPGNGLPATATAPVAEIDALANALAPCVNSIGTDSACASLFAAATPASGTAPANTIAAMLNINANPGNNVAALFNLVQPSAPFQPALTVAPNDWTVALKFTGGGLNAPTAIALDANGNAWVANAGGNSVTELSNTGTLLTGAAGYTGNNTILGAQAIAVDTKGDVWVADTLLSSIVELTVVGGVLQSSATYTAGGISGPTGIAIDKQNNVWVSNFAGGSVTELNSSGAPVGSSPLGGGILKGPLGIAVDSGGNVWVSDNLASAVAEFGNNQGLLSGSGYADSAILAPVGVALDASGHAWIADNGTNTVSLFAPNGSPLFSAPLLGGGLAMPAAVAVDGQGTAWVANSQTAGSVSATAFGASNPLSPATGYGVLNAPCGIAVDASGSVWTANSGDNSISEFIGVAMPQIMPLAAAAGP